MKNTAVKTLVSLFAMTSFAFAGTEAVSTKTVDAAKMPVAPMVTFKVVSVDNAAKMITVTEMVKGADGKEMTKETKINWNDQTKLAFRTADAKTTAATLVDLTPGAMVTVRYADANPTLANEIQIVRTEVKPVAPATTK